MFIGSIGVLFLKTLRPRREENIDDQQECLKENKKEVKVENSQEDEQEINEEGRRDNKEENTSARRE